MAKKLKRIIASTAALCFVALLCVLLVVGGTHYGCCDDGCRVCGVLKGVSERLWLAALICVALCAALLLRGELLSFSRRARPKIFDSLVLQKTELLN